MSLAAFLLPADSSDGRSRAGDLTVMSYNIRYGTAPDGPNEWSRRRHASVEMIDDNSPDIICIQEAFSFQIDYILDNCPDYRSVGISRLGERDAEHPAVFYNTKRLRVVESGNFWLSETPDKPGLGWDAACERNLTWVFFEEIRSGRLFYCLNVHLDHVGKLARLEGLKMVTGFLDQKNADGLPVVFCGDFNAEDGDASIDYISGKMANARLTSKGKTDDYATYNGWGNSATKIDFIFHSGFRACRSYETVNDSYGGCRYISDHYPVKAVLSFPSAHR